MKTSAKAQFEKELNERLAATIKIMLEDEMWKEVFSHLSQEQIVDTIAMVFLSTNIQKGSEQSFIKAVMALNK